MLTAHGTADAIGEIVVAIVLAVLLEFEYFSDGLNELNELEAKVDRNDDVLFNGLGLLAAADAKMLDEVELIFGVDELVEEAIRLKLDNPLLVFKIWEPEDGSEVVVEPLWVARITELLALDNCGLDDVEI